MINIKCKSATTMSIDDLTEFQGDLKHRTKKDVEKIANSIMKHGFSFPFFVWKHDGINHVFDGHGRLLALKKLRKEGEEIPALPVSFVEAKDEAEAKELLLKLNSQYGTMTADSVAEFLNGLEINVDELQLPEGVLDLSKLETTEQTVEDDDVPELEEDVAVSKYGEVYQLGKHRLMCGDSTKIEDMKKLMGDAKADLIVTDPPYNVNYEGGTGLKIKNDNMADNNFLCFLTDAFKTMFEVLKLGGAFYIWHADSEGFNFRAAVKNAGGVIKQCLIWVKNSLVLGRQDYQWRHEPCLYGWKEGAAHFWNGDRSLTTVMDAKPNYKNMSKEQLLQEIEVLRGDNKPSSIIYEDKPSKNDAHPTMKPVKLFERLIKNSSKEEDIVLDSFGGSGTAIIACEKTNRVCRTMELDPHYCDVIRKRYTAWAKDNGIEVGTGALE